MKKRLLLSVVMFSSSVFATPVNINSADAQTISNSLIGINLKKAEAIVANREQNGAFKSVDDLKRVIAIGEKTIAVNRENILLADSQTLSVNNAVLNVTPTASAENTAEAVQQRGWILQIAWVTSGLVLLSLLALFINKYWQQKKSKVNNVPTDF